MFSTHTHGLAIPQNADLYFGEFLQMCIIILVLLYDDILLYLWYILLPIFLLAVDNKDAANEGKFYLPTAGCEFPTIPAFESLKDLPRNLLLIAKMVR